MELPLDFVKSEHKLLWNNGSVITVLGEEKGIFVSGKGVVKPAGSTWARNPIPRVNTDNRGLANEAGCNGRDGRNNKICQQFEALCPQDTGTYPMCSDTQGWSVKGAHRSNPTSLSFLLNCARGYWWRVHAV